MSFLRGLMLASTVPARVGPKEMFMKAIIRAVTTTLGLAVFAATLTPSVFAGCGGGMPGKAAPAGKQPKAHFMQAAYRPARFVFVDNNPAGADVVGLWHVVFTLDSGGPFDDSYSEWHSDGTEIMNSGLHNPAGGNFCMGAWTKTGGSTYVLTHIALDYSMEPSGSLSPDAIIIIHEWVTVDRTGNHFTGTFTAQAYAPLSGTATLDPNNPLGPPAAGAITGDRITAN
jgi:hypothetical protein